ncbi:MAG: DUF5606 domain-containing protein [Bacteroidota bacterium]
MALKGILAIGGKPGLFKHITQSKNAIIVEEISTGKRMPAYASSKISALEDIAIYTDSEEVHLREVYLKLKDITSNSKLDFDPKKTDNEKLKSLMEQVLPNYDREKVYVSDMRKLFSWYNFLHEYNLLDLEEEKEEKVEEIKAEEVEKVKKVPAQKRKK